MSKIIKFISIFALFGILVGVIASASAQTLKSRDETARAKYQQAKEQYQEEANFYKSARQDFLNAQTKYRKLKNTENKKDLEDKARSFLEKTVNGLIKRLEAVKNWVSNRRALSETERQAIIAEIDKDISWLNQRLPGIQSASPAQIKEEAKTVRDYWKNHRLAVKRILGRIEAARINFLISKAEGFSAKVSAKIEELKTAGKDSAQLEAWLNDFNQKLALAKEKYETAKTKFQAISGLAEANQLFRQAHQFVKEAHQYVRQAHAQLVKIVKEMKNMVKGVEVETSTTE